MKFWKHTFITAIAFVGISSSVLYTACEKDSCTELRCKNGGSCAEGFCRCRTGFEGAECEIKSADRFVGRFYGNSRCNGNPNVSDTVDIWIRQEPNLVNIVRRSAFNDTLVGTVSGTTVNIPDIYENNVSRYASAVIDLKKLTLYVEQSGNVAGGVKTVCTFIGSRP